MKTHTEMTNLLRWHGRLSLTFRVAALSFVELSSVVFATLLSVASLQAAQPIYHLSQPTSMAQYGEIEFFLRMPKGVEFVEGSSGARRGGPQVRGILAICTHRAETDYLKRAVSDGGIFPWYVQFADKHNLALVTWSNFRGYQTRLSWDEMDEDSYNRYDRDFNSRVREWRTGFLRLCRRFNLPERNVLMYGLSGGGQMAHRLALRQPEFFFAVHIHVNSSYDRIRRDGNRILWLVTTGSLEYGYPAGVRFYREALDAGYHMIFRAEENLGHADSWGTRTVSVAFFEYCIPFLPDASDPQWRAPPVDQFYLMRYPTYIGDFLNNEAFPASVASQYMQPEVMVALPNKEIAEAWGMVLNIEK